MKKLFVILVTCSLLASCGDKVTISKEQYEVLTGKQEYPRDITIDHVDGWGSGGRIIKIEGCEYVVHNLGSNTGVLSHKGDCKFCWERQRLLIQELIDLNFETKDSTP